MINKHFTNNLTSLTKQLTSRKEVDFIYYIANEVKGKQFINCNIICDIDSVVANEGLLKEIIANMEIAKALYSKTNITFNYTIKTTKSFEEDLIEDRNKILNELSNGNVIYSNDEYLEDYFIYTNRDEKSRH